MFGHNVRPFLVDVLLAADIEAELCLGWRDAGEEQVVMLGAAARSV